MFNLDFSITNRYTLSYIYLNKCPEVSSEVQSHCGTTQYANGLIPFLAVGYSSISWLLLPFSFPEENISSFFCN